MKYDLIQGLDKKISKLIMGNDNQTDFDEASKLWDHWIEVGGNTFDNAHIYGGGSMETLLGKWHKSRKNLKELVVIAKGAHTPNCNPQSISLQLNESLDRLQCDAVDIYIMHRDNLDVPVNEFIDALNEEKNKGRIKIFGGSNWTINRFQEANNWAEKNKKAKFSILNNNLALSKMINPLWDGCVSSNDEETLVYLQKTQTAHLSWSSQGRGYFLDDNITKKIEEQITQLTDDGKNISSNILLRYAITCMYKEEYGKATSILKETLLKTEQLGYVLNALAVASSRLRRHRPESTLGLPRCWASRSRRGSPLMTRRTWTSRLVGRSP